MALVRHPRFNLKRQEELRSRRLISYSSISMNGTSLGLWSSVPRTQPHSSISMNGTSLGQATGGSKLPMNSSISMDGTSLGRRPEGMPIDCHSSISMNGTPLGPSSNGQENFRYSSISMNDTSLGLNSSASSLEPNSSISMNGTPLGLFYTDPADCANSSTPMNATPLGFEAQKERPPSLRRWPNSTSNGSAQLITTWTARYPSILPPQRTPFIPQNKRGAPEELPAVSRLGRNISWHRDSYPRSCSTCTSPQSSCSNPASALFASQISSSDSPASCDSTSPTGQP